MLILKFSVPGVSLPRSVQTFSINSYHRPGSFKNVNFDDRSSNKNRQLWSRANLVAALRVLGSITAAVSPGGNSIPSVSLSISMLSPEVSSSSCRPTISRSIIVLASFTLAQQLGQLRDD